MPILLVVILALLAGVAYWVLRNQRPPGGAPPSDGPDSAGPVDPQGHDDDLASLVAPREARPAGDDAPTTIERPPS
jgi:hypothetical protein